MQGLQVSVLRLPLRLVAEAFTSHASVASSPQWTQLETSTRLLAAGGVRTSSLFYWNGFQFPWGGKLSPAYQHRSLWWLVVPVSPG